MKFPNSICRSGSERVAHLKRSNEWLQALRKQAVDLLLEDVPPSDWLHDGPLEYLRFSGTRRPISRPSWSDEIWWPIWDVGWFWNMYLKHGNSCNSHGFSHGFPFVWRDRALDHKATTCSTPGRRLPLWRTVGRKWRSVRGWEIPRIGGFLSHGGTPSHPF